MKSSIAKAAKEDNTFKDLHAINIPWRGCALTFVYPTGITGEMKTFENAIGIEATRKFTAHGKC